jgi:hypothetical protein
MEAACRSKTKLMANKVVLLLVSMSLLVIPGRTADDPDPDAPEFVFARLVYSSGFGGGRFGGGRWATDYPEADYKFMYGIKRLSGVRVKEEENPVQIMDQALFNYPYIYVVEPGGMNLSRSEADQLREYFLRGGFMHVDDFWGLEERQNLVNQMKKIFPDRDLEELPLTHEIFHTFYDVDRVMQIPNVSNACRGGRTWERASDTAPRIYGIKDSQGRVMVVITYNSDLGDAWEWMDEPCYPELFSGQSYRMGLNFIIYSMSH